MAAKVHFLNVKQGDCTIIQHASGRVGVVDICAGNIERRASKLAALVEARLGEIRGNFRMCEKPTNPLDYLSDLGVSSVFRFILTHPDMDHMDGFDAFMDAVNLLNYWDSGVRKEKPDFSEGGYDEDDWDRYEKVRDGRESDVTVVTPRAGSKFQYANQNESKESGGDGLYVLAPDDELVNNANDGGDVNDASFVILYRSIGGKILLPGDAHDKTWEYVLKHYKDDVSDCSILLAPHHGRKSGRSYDFLDTVRPKLTLFGCAPSEHLAYSAWQYRDLPYITNNQAGNVVMECANDQIEVYVENKTFAEKAGGNVYQTNAQGYYYLVTV